MKILMFGWEFPPHISGGLGTACFGLTTSLAKSDTKILFVIPKADRETISEKLRIISASNIDLSGSIVKHKIQLKQQGDKSEAEEEKSNFEQINVHSELRPYTSQDVFLEKVSIARWNYQFSEASSSPSSLVTGPTSEPVGIRYQFSGAYGPNLIDEVTMYGLAGGEVARRNDFDVIHAHDWLTFAAGIAAKKLSGKPLVVHVHATEVDRAGKNVDAQIFNIEREGMEAADRIIAVSQWTKNIIVSHYSIPADKIQVVHNGVQQVNQKSNIKPPIGKQLITFLGRITHQKGPEYFVDAAHKVLQKFPDVHFVMAGAGDLLSKMIERVARLRISSHFHFTGFLNSENIAQLWAGSSIYVMPSVSEPFGISPLEAVQAGIPVIISKQSGVAEVMQHVVKVDFWNIEALADAMCNILTYQSLSGMLTTKSKNEIGNVTWEHAAEKVNSIYHELAKQ